MRLCYLNERFDPEASSLLSNWHDWCDGYITYTPTSPILSHVTTTYPTFVGSDGDPLCKDFTTSCAIWSASEASCLALDPSATAASFLDCACRAELLSLASVCLYDASVTCFGLSATLADLPLWSICKTTFGVAESQATTTGSVVTSSISSVNSGGTSSNSIDAQPQPTRSSSTAFATGAASSTVSLPNSAAAMVGWANEIWHGYSMTGVARALLLSVVAFVAL
ncbi:uncharacterized protein AB675_7640 [Cyphellophora attinorum]|uniref:Uncharacterized protein n=1 Tax=Cyphellophora attinorum TaxID=1664694 RepID=A0A0N0NMI8_9EURO|nr:uncharacterized protein AB675_7640 [Phialophora attinorum]KPI40511.1 hypothetical protein AB675_7640 [Phialophora attinorum]